MALKDNARSEAAGRSRFVEASVPDRLHRDLARSLDPFIAWIALGFGFGAVAYLALPAEPNWLLTAFLLGSAVALVLRLRRSGTQISIPAILLLATVAGIGWTKLHANVTGTEQIDWRRGPVEIVGDVVLAEPRGGSTARLTIDVVTLGDWDDKKRPRRIRITRRGLEDLPRPGQRVRLRAILMPPPDAGYPGGFDFRRQAYFSGLGAVGFALTDPEIVGEGSTDRGTTLRDRIEAVRQTIERRLIEAAPGPTGGLAAALIVGKRGSIDDDAEADLRDTGLAHILAISGLHMALFAGTVFALVRAGFALFPGLSARLPIKKMAALAALLGAVVYLLLSGASIATQRAFIMAVVMFVAILADRPALTLRNVALAALIVLVIAPEAAAGASFQMSFAAATALVVVYQAWNTRATTRSGPPIVMWAVAYVLALALTSLVAGLATAPYAAYHFNRVAAYGLIANMLAMPAFGTLVMPFGALTLLSLPFGLERFPLAIMDWGIGYILAAADMIAGWEGARITLAAQPGLTAFALTLALYVACIARGWLRAASLPVLAIGIGAASLTTPPDVLIARNGDMIAVRDGAQLRLAGITRSNYTVELWHRVLALDEPDGAGDFQRCRRAVCRLETNGLHVALYDTDPTPGADCDADIVVLRGRQRNACPDADILLDWDEIDRNGAMAIWRAPSGYDIRGARDTSHRRPWGLTP